LGLKGFEATTALPSPRSVNCPMTILAVLGSTHSRMQFVVPERIGKLPGRQAVAECGLQPDQVQPLALHVFDPVLA